MKILWLSEIGVGTSFSRVTEEMAHEFYKLGHKITVVSKHKEINKFRYLFKVCYDGQIPRNEIFDVVIFLGSTDDAISMVSLLKDFCFKTLKCCYCPIEFKNNKCEQLNFYDKIFTMTEFGKGVINIPKKTFVVNHGVSLESFFKLNRKRCRERCRELGFNINDNDFIIFNGNRNEYRKRIDLTIESFLKFKKFCPNAKLWLHCGNLEHDDPNIIITSPKSTTHPNYATGTLNIFYNACDVGINTSMGEGWGLVSFEMAALGIPQIVPNFSSYPELFGENKGHEMIRVKEEKIGWCGNTKATSYEPIGGIIDSSDCAEAMKKIYMDYNKYYLVAQKNSEYFRSFTYEKVTKSMEKNLFKK